MLPPALSHLRGPAPAPLLGKTMGENLRRTVARFGSGAALVVAHLGFRATHDERWQLGQLAKTLLAPGGRVGDCGGPSGRGGRSFCPCTPLWPSCN